MLRIAHVQQGSVRWERVIERGVWSLRDGELERGGRAPLFLVEDGEIRVLSGEGRVRRGSEVEGHAGPITLALDDHARWTADGCTLLLQVIERPAQRPRSGLPPALRRGGAIDRRFTAIATASLMAHFAFVVVLENMDAPYVAAATLSPRVVELMMDAPAPPPVAPPELASNDDDEAPSELAERTAEADAPGPSTPGPRPRAARPISGEEIARMVAEGTSGLSSGVLSALGETTRAGATSSAGAVLASMDGAHVTSGGPVLATRGGGGVVPTGGLGELAAAGGDGAMRAEGDAIEARGPVGVVRPSPVIDEPSSGWLDPRTVTAAIRSRTAAIRRCYERELRDQPTLAGSLDVAFTIEATGEVTGVHVGDDTMGSDRMNTCVLGVVRSIRRFSTLPEGGAARFTYPLVFVPGA